MTAAGGALPRVLRIRGGTAIAGFTEAADRDADAAIDGGNDLARAVRDFRDRIERDETMQLLNVEVLIDRFHRFARRWPVEIPFADDDGLLELELLREWRLDRIQVASAFGDVLGFRPPEDRGVLVHIAEVLDRWTGVSATAWLVVIYRSVLEFLDGIRNGVAADDAARATSFVRRGGDRRLLLRLAAEFASLRAMKDEHEPFELRMIEAAADAGSPADRWPIPVEVYAFPAAAPSRLTGLERDLCIKYATTVLQWDGSAPPYPAWLSS